MTRVPGHKASSHSFTHGIVCGLRSAFNALIELVFFAMAWSLPLRPHVWM